MQPASFSKRFFALIVDSLICAMLSGIAQTVSRKLIGDGPMIFLFGLLIQALIFYFYVVRPLKQTGQTFGKRVLGIQVLAEGEISSWVVFKREVIGKFISAMPMGLGYLPPLFGGERRTLHDMIAGTQVVSVEQGEETTGGFKKKIALGALGLVSLVVAGISALLWTSLPLSSIRESLVAQGIKVGNISGSLAGGIHLENISFEDDSLKFQLESAALQADLRALLDSHVHIVNISSESGEFEWVSHEKKTTQTSLSETKSKTQDIHQKQKKMQNADGNGMKISIDTISFKNILFKSPEKTVKLKNLTAKDFHLANAEMTLKSGHFESDGILIDLSSFSVNVESGKMTIPSLTGEVRPALFKVLKKPITFNLKIQRESQAANYEVEGKILDGLIEGKWNKTEPLITSQKLPVLQYMNSALPIEDLQLSFNYSAKSLEVSGELKLCGVPFHYENGVLKGVKGADLYYLKPVPKKTPDVTVAQAPSTKEALLEDYISFEVSTQKSGSAEEIASDLCLGKPLVSLSSDEKSKISKLTPFIHSLAGASNVTPPISTPSVAAQPIASQASSTLNPPREPASTVESIESYRQRYVTARNFLAKGDASQAVQILAVQQPPPLNLPLNEALGTQRLLAWSYLKSGQAQKAQEVFTDLFTKTQEISDAEGLKKSAEVLNDKVAIEKWRQYIKQTVKAQPELKLKLTGSTQRELASER